MVPEVFVASRWTQGNMLFSTQIVITEHAVMRRKRSWLSVNEESINIRNVASVNIRTGIIWSDIRIESSGGSDSLESHGHTKADARRIKDLIETLQARAGGGAGGGSRGGLRGRHEGLPLVRRDDQEGGEDLPVLREGSAMIPSVSLRATMPSLRVAGGTRLRARLALARLRDRLHSDRPHTPGV